LEPANAKVIALGGGNMASYFGENSARHQSGGSKRCGQGLRSRQEDARRKDTRRSLKVWIRNHILPKMNKPQRRTILSEQYQ